MAQLVEAEIALDKNYRFDFERSLNYSAGGINTPATNDALRAHTARRASFVSAATTAGLQPSGENKPAEQLRNF